MQFTWDHKIPDIPTPPTTIDATCNLHPNSEHSVNIASHARIYKLGHTLFCNLIVALARITITIVGKVRWFCRGSYTNTVMLPDVRNTFTEEDVEIAQAGLLACICLLRWSSTDPISCQAAPLCQLDHLKFDYTNLMEFVRNYRHPDSSASSIVSEQQVLTHIMTENDQNSGQKINEVLKEVVDGFQQTSKNSLRNFKDSQNFREKINELHAQIYGFWQNSMDFSRNS